MKSHVQRLVVSVVNHGAFLSFLLLLLKIKVLLEHRREAVSLQEAGLLDHFFLIGRQSLEIVQQRDAVSCKSDTVSPIFTCFCTPEAAYMSAHPFGNLTLLVGWSGRASGLQKILHR